LFSSNSISKTYFVSHSGSRLALTDVITFPFSHLMTETQAVFEVIQEAEDGGHCMFNDMIITDFTKN